jgi:serine/threonine-protein kinase
VCSSLAEAHALGIIHRDLKPTNIHLEPHGPDDDLVKVLDFGIAKIVHESDIDNTDLTHAGQMIGTLDYMSPEQMVGGICTPASDIYTLGVVMYEMIAGRKPFDDANSAAAALAAVLTTTPARLSLQVVVPADVDRIVMHCLERHHHERYQSAAALAAALDEVLTNGDEAVTTVDLSHGRGMLQTIRGMRLPAKLPMQITRPAPPPLTPPRAEPAVVLSDTLRDPEPPAPAPRAPAGTLPPDPLAASLAAGEPAITAAVRPEHRPRRPTPLPGASDLPPGFAPPLPRSTPATPMPIAASPRVTPPLPKLVLADPELPDGDAPADANGARGGLPDHTLVGVLPTPRAPAPRQTGASPVDAAAARQSDASNIEPAPARQTGASLLEAIPVPRQTGIQLELAPFRRQTGASQIDVAPISRNLREAYPNIHLAPPSPLRPSAVFDARHTPSAGTGAVFDMSHAVRRDSMVRTGRIVWRVLIALAVLVVAVSAFLIASEW